MVLLLFSVIITMSHSKIDMFTKITFFFINQEEIKASKSNVLCVNEELAIGIKKNITKKAHVQDVDISRARHVKLIPGALISSEVRGGGGGGGKGGGGPRSNVDTRNLETRSTQ